MKVLIIGNDWPRHMQAIKHLCEEMQWDVEFQSLDRIGEIKGLTFDSVIVDELFDATILQFADKEEFVTSRRKPQPYWRQGERW